MLIWFDIASCIGCSLQEAQAKVPSTEFVLWREYLKLEYNRPSRTDMYLAQVALEVRRANFKHPERIKLSDFVLKFKSSKKKSISWNQRLAASKAWAMSLVGIKKDV